jgi:hypothetical protein
LVVREADARHPVSVSRPRRWCRQNLELREAPRPSVSHIRGKTNAICDGGAKYEHGFFRAMIFFGDWSLVASCWQLQVAVTVVRRSPATSNQH